MKSALLVSLLLGNIFCVYLCAYLDNAPGKGSCCSAKTDTSQEDGALPDSSCRCTMEKQFHNDMAHLDLNNIAMSAVDILPAVGYYNAVDSGSLFIVAPSYKGHSPPLYLLTNSFLI